MPATVEFSYYSDTHSADIKDYKIQSFSITGIDKYTQQPTAVRLTLFSDDWMTTRFLETGYEHQDNISQYLAEVNIQQLNSLYKFVLTGVIDLSTVSYDNKLNEISFTVYDKIYLFTKTLPTLENNLTLENNTLEDMILAIDTEFFAKYQNLRIQTGNTGYSIDVSKPTIEKTDLEIFKTNKTELTELMDLPDEWQDNADYTYHKSGFFNNFQDRTFFVELAMVQIELDSWWVVRVHRIFHNIQYSNFYEAHGTATETSDPPPMENALGKINSHMSVYFQGGEDWFQTYLSDALPLPFESNANYSVTTVGDDYRVAFTGNIIPTYFQFGKSQETVITSQPTGLDQNKQTSIIKAIKAILTIYNQFLLFDGNANLRIKSKEFTQGAPHAIAREDLIEYKNRRVIPPKFPSKDLDVLSGNKELFIELLEESATDFFNQIISVSATIIDDYNLNLLTSINIEGSDMRITALYPMIKNKIVRLDAWRT